MVPTPAQTANELPNGSPVTRYSSLVVIDGRPWTDDDHDVFMFRRLIVVLRPTDCRLPEVAGGPELSFFTFESLPWSVRETVITQPDEPQLLAMRSSKAVARLTPPRST